MTDLATESVENLVARCRHGDQKSWDEVISRYARLVHFVAIRHGLSQVEAEDVAQEVFLTLAQSLDTIEDPARLPAWLATTARRLCWRVGRRRRRESPGERADLSDEPSIPSAAPLFVTMPSVEELNDEWHRQEALATAMARLGERCRNLITLLFLQEHDPSYDEISAQIAIPKGSIGPTRSRCLQQLRSLLEGLGFDREDLLTNSAPETRAHSSRLIERREM